VNLIAQKGKPGEVFTLFDWQLVVPDYLQAGVLEQRGADQPSRAAMCRRGTAGQVQQQQRQQQAV